jgi:hypothetical protein
MTPYELHRYPDAVPELFPVCWRPRGHPGDKHLSRAAYLRNLEAKSLSRRPSRSHARKPCPSEAAHKRHIRHGEVPCEGCRAEANRIANARRKAETGLAA